MELCHLSLLSTGKLNRRHSAPTRAPPEHQACCKLKRYYPRSKWKVSHYKKVDSEPKHSEYIQAVHHPEQICGKSNITLADGVAEGKKSFLTSKTTAVKIFRNSLAIWQFSACLPHLKGHWLTSPVMRRGHLERQHSLQDKISPTSYQVGHRIISSKQGEYLGILKTQQIHISLCTDQ